MDIVEELVAGQRALKAIRTVEKQEEELMEEQPLSPASRLFHEPNFNCYIISVLGCNTKINLEVVKAGLERTLLKHPRFSSIQVMDKGEKVKQMRWIRTTVKLDNHICVPDLDPNMESPDEFVEDYISNLTKTTIDMSRPLWDLHLLNVKTAHAEAIGIFRIHHSLGDGVSLVSLLLACTRKTSDPDALPSFPMKKAKKVKSLKEHNMVWSVVKLIWVVFRLMWNSLVDIFAALCTCVFLKDTSTPLKAAAGAECVPKRVVFRIIDLNDIKLVKDAMDVVSYYT